MINLHLLWLAVTPMYLGTKMRQAEITNIRRLFHGFAKQNYGIIGNRLLIPETCFAIELKNRLPSFSVSLYLFFYIGEDVIW